MAGKGHDRAAGLQLIRQVDLPGSLVSADALQTQPAWCEQILAQGGDYLVIAKGNQSQLRAEIALLFGQPPLPWLPESQATQPNKGHGRLEVRQMRTSAELDDFLAPKWPGVQQVFQLERRSWRQGQLATDVVYGMTSLPPNVPRQPPCSPWSALTGTLPIVRIGAGTSRGAKTTAKSLRPSPRKSSPL